MAVNGWQATQPALTAPEWSAIDVHAHAMPLPLLQRLAEDGLADLSGVADGLLRLDPDVSGVGPHAPLTLARSQYDVDVRLSEMDEVGVRYHVVSLPPFLICSTALDGRFATRTISDANDELATYVADAPDRLFALGSVPVGWPGAAEEARRALDELGMAGIGIGSRGAGRYLDDPVNDDLWALLSERRTFVFLHPSSVPDSHRQVDYWLRQLVGYPMETALAVARLVGCHWAEGLGLAAARRRTGRRTRR
jgi:aminocarboxymuconate-semialdehyde decarboxylase